MAGKRSRTASAICDRTGIRYPMSQMVIEPGTGYLVHKSVSDGKWNAVDHPMNHVSRYARFGDPKPVENARPDINWVDTVEAEDVEVEEWLPDGWTTFGGTED